MEDKLNILNTTKISKDFIEKIFSVRSDLLRMRSIVNSMRDLLYRIINSHHLEGFPGHPFYLSDIYDHLLKLSDMIESNREITSDLRDSYLSLNANRTSNIMALLTIITSIFIPLTFIVGIYGMNFKYMPELQWRYGYFFVLGIMAIIALSMIYWFRKKGWFNF